MKTEATRITDLPDVMGTREIIRFLPLGRSAVYELLRNGTIPSVALGKRRYIITKDALKRFLGLDEEPGRIPSLSKGGSQ